MIAFTNAISTTLANGVVIAYGYDAGNQLTSITYTNGGTTIGDLAYTFDAAGRRTSISGSLAATDLPAAVASAVYNANNRLTSWAGTALTYDLNGNMTGDGTNTYTWNARDELASISGGATASFVYDGLGRRRAKTVAGVQTGFVYDGENFVQELNGATVTANLMTGGIDELFARKEGSTASYPLTDALGSVIGLTDASGVLQTQYSYEPYGKATRSGAGTTNSQTYTGREDDGTGRYYFRGRYYGPISGRFVSEDPIEFDGGPNLYAYVDDDPILYVDPLGEAGHTKGKRPSTKGKHEAGDARRKQDQGGERGDDVRRPPRKRPPGYKGPWPRPASGSKSEMCGDTCKMSALVAGICVVCALQPELCLPVGAAAAASQ